MCVSFRCTPKWFSVYIHTHIYVNLLFRLFSHIDYYRIMRRVSCATEYVLANYFMYCSVYMLTPNSSFISPPTHTLSPFSNHKCICLFWGPWVCFYLVNKFFCSFPPTPHISAMWCWSLSDTPHVVWSSLAQPCCCGCTISFLLWLCSGPLCMCTASSPSIPLLMDM